MLLIYKGIKMKKSSFNYEKRGGEKRKIKCNYKPPNSKKIQRLLQEKFYKQIRQNGKVNLKIFGGRKMKATSINPNTEANKVDAKIIEQLTKIKLKPDRDYFYNVVFENKKKPDFIIKNFDNKNKYSFIIENKLKYGSLINAKKQALDYAHFLFEKDLLTKYFVLIITDSKSFYVSKYKIEEKIIYLEDLDYIDCFEDLTIDFFKTNSMLQDIKEISLQNQRNLKDTFDKINNKLRGYGVTSDQRLHLTMAFLFLKLIKENTDLFGKTKYRKELDENLKNLDTNATETSIKNVFDTIAKIFENKFSFSINEYFGSAVLTDMWEIIKGLDLDSYDLDVKGEAFEYFINYGSIHSDIGEYFTPRHIVKFIIRCLNEVMKDRWLTNTKGQIMTYIDPTCGTGGFLINIFKQLRREIGDDKKLMPVIKTNCVWGVELSKRTSEIAKMNMILAGDGHTNIINQDFIEFKKTHNNIYDVSIGNMPFGKKINEPAFVEGFLDIIKREGYSIFIAPSGIIGTTSKRDYIRIREKLLTEGQIIKLISLPQGVFAPYTFSKTYVIFWKKGRPKTNYDIEFIEIENDGFTLNNQRDKIKGNSDIDLYFKDKNKLFEKKQIFYVNSDKIFNIKELNDNLILLSSASEELSRNQNKLSILKKQLSDIKNKQQREEKQNRIIEISKKIKELIKQIKDIEKYKSNLDYSLKFSKFKPSLNHKKDNREGLMDLGGKDGISKIIRGPFGSSIKKSVCVNKEEGGKYKIYEQGNVINNNFEIGRYYLTEDKFEELKRFEIQQDDVLMTCAGTLGKIALVPEKFEKGIFNSVLMRFRVNKDLIRPKYLEIVLESDDIQRKLVKDAIGVGIKNMVPTKEIEIIKIPVPKLEEQDKIIKEMEDIDKDIKKRLEEIEEIKDKKNEKLNSIK